ncbi:MAG: hypothetical protein VR73_14745 [Gammaproteobacteria bacterium BRH_c0]|nr:MAG: hypothetical protein VR73_14745 [Gammaproteobacteria bacterium BRH_c0]
MSNDHNESLAAIKIQQENIQTSIRGLQEIVQKVRQQIAAKRGEIHAIKDAHVPASVATERFTSHVRTKAERSGFERQVWEFWKPDRYSPGVLFPGFGSENPEAPNIAAIDIDAALCFLFQDEIIERFKAITAEGLKPGLPLDERPAVLAKLEAELLQLEIEEEALIVELDRMGFPIERREDARPEVVLEWQD